MPHSLANSVGRPPTTIQPPARRAALAPAQPPAVGWALSHWRAPSSRAPDPSMDPFMDAAMHGVRNSLSAIRLGVDLLARRGDMRESDPVLEHIDSAARRAHEQAEELADFCRLAAGRPIALVEKRFSLHTTVAQALAAWRSDQPAGGMEHDRLGHGECRGDPARLAQFVRLALEELEAHPAPRRIVVSEIDGARFRVAVHAGQAPAPGSPAHSSQSMARAQRLALLQAIAHAHRGELRLGTGAPHGWSIEGLFGEPG